MSEKSREHIHQVMLNAVHYVGISKLMAKLECSKSAAILYALNSGLYHEDVITPEDYDLLKNRYGRKLIDVISAGREDSHKPVLTLEQEKQKQFLKQKDQQFKGMLEQWDDHPQFEWRLKAVTHAKKFPDLEHAKLLIAKAEECDIISQGETS